MRSHLQPCFTRGERWHVCLRLLLGVASIVSFLSDHAAAGPSSEPTSGLAAKNYASGAREVTDYIQTTFLLSDGGLYAHSVTDRKPEFMWGNGILFSALLGAARHDPQAYAPAFERFFKSMDRYWDTLDTPPGYEPSPTTGGRHDKYYDDNAWMVLTYCEAFEMTHDPKYLTRAQQALDFVLSGWDDKLGGGIWWHEAHKDGTKNTCVNAPAAVGCLRIAKYLPPEKSNEYQATARKIVDWTAKTFEEEGLYSDRITVETRRLHRGKRTYNTALMIRAFLGLYRDTNDQDDLSHAKRCAAAADWFVDPKTNAYSDPPKWSHLLVEADLEMYRATRDEHLLRRAVQNADYEYASWKQSHPDTLIENASIARTLWLMADMQSEQGRKFWERMDQSGATPPR
jgi:hypothetical protein